MARIDYKVSVTPIETTAAGADGGGVQTDVISYNFQKSLGGGNSSLTWGGADSTEWSNGTNTMITANGGTIATPASCEGVWVKNSGYTFADQTVLANTDSKVSLTIGGVIVAVLGVGEGMFFPNPADSQSPLITLDDVGTDDVAVEYAIFS